MSPRRSHWAWGYEERFADREAREQLGRMVEAMIGVTPAMLSDPVPLDQIEVAPPRVSPPAALAELFELGPEAAIRHTYGRAYPDIVRGFYGDFTGAPDLVARPRDAEDVRRLLDWASEERVAVVPFGGGTSVVGGVNAGEVAGQWRAVLSLDTRAMNQLLEVDRESMSAHLGAGALGPEIEDALRPHGLTLRHFPQSFEFSTLGGWLATRAGGHFATLYTHIDDLTQSMRAVTPRGEIVTRRLPGSGAGPSPDRMLLGSEGALGVITDAWMRVRPRPRFVGKADVLFARFEDAVAATRAISQAGLYPTNCRLLDAREAALNQVAMDGRCVLLLGFESAHHEVRWPLERAVEIARGHGGECEQAPRYTDREREQGAREGAAGQWRQAFFDGPYLQSTLVSLGVLADTFETACTWSSFEALHADIIRSMRQAMLEVCGQKGRISCRFTHVYPDGPAPYYTYIAPITPGSELEQWRELKAAASEALMRHGATITHHHAVGRIHHPWWARDQRPPLFGEALAAARRALDPEGVLNPGVLVP